MSTTGVALLRGALDPGLIERLLDAARVRYSSLDADVARRGPWQVAASTPAALRFVPTASSIALDALGPIATGAIEQVEGTLLPISIAWFGQPPRRLLDQSWLRRQFAPERAPRWHAPHAWHQDGGLGFDYLAGDPDSPDALLPMLTAWIPLMPCGRDGPGLRYDPIPRDRLIALDRLEHEAGRAAERIVTPALDAGDVLLMTGGALHATAVDGSMTRDRISVELRWLPGDHPGRGTDVTR